MGVGYGLAQVLQTINLQNYTASRIGLMLSGGMAGTLEAAYRGPSTKTSRQVCQWIEANLNKGRVDLGNRAQNILITFAFAFFTNLTCFVATGCFRSMTNVVVMTGLNMGAGTLATEALKSYDVIA